MAGGANVIVSVAIAYPNTSFAVSGGVAATIPALGSVDFSYTCIGFVGPAGTETNTGTATWSQQVLTDGSALGAGSANGTATVDWSTVVPRLVDGSVTLSDTLGRLLRTVSYSDPSPTSFHYSHTVTGTPGTC